MDFSLFLIATDAMVSSAIAHVALAGAVAAGMLAVGALAEFLLGRAAAALAGRASSRGRLKLPRRRPALAGAPKAA